MLDKPIHHHRRSIRLKDYDYASPGAYFVTVVTHRRICLFGEAVGGEMILNEYGQVVSQTWRWLPNQYPYLILYPYCVMPNHFHGIIQIVETDVSCRGGSRPAPTPFKPLGQLIGAFKTISAKHINLLRGTPATPVWQGNYYEHILRDLPDLDTTSSYVLSNPLNWHADPEFNHTPARSLP